jgi:antitoxin VapB
MTTTAKLFRNGRSQAVRLPREFRFEGDRVRVRRAGRGVLVEPMFANVADWFAELDRFGAEPFMADGRPQPPTPVREIFRS